MPSDERSSIGGSDLEGFLRVGESNRGGGWCIKECSLTRVTSV